MVRSIRALGTHHAALSCVNIIGGYVKTKSVLVVIVSVLLLCISVSCYGDSEQLYDETVNLIKETMASNTSVSRKESYKYINFDKCVLQYHVSGTYPVGDLYNITFSDIDFSGLNYKLSRTGHDYTAFVILNFNKHIKFKDDFKELTVETVVINMFDDAAAQLLFKAFLRLGELCGASEILPPTMTSIP